MTAKIFKVVQYAAACLECKWYGKLYNDSPDGEKLAERDMARHNKEVHS